MSTDMRNNNNLSDTKQSRDRGLTLPELLITMTLMGMLATVLAASLTVTFRSATSTEGRANVARSEAAVDTWLPADLASTDVNNLDVGGSGEPSVELAADAEPCGNCTGIDLSGTNAMQLAWETNGSITKVQYQYIQIDGEWMLRRIECITGQQCSVSVILHDLDGPPDAASFDPDATRPVWVMDVAVPTNPVGLDLDDNARRIVVTIDGGGENEGAGGGLNSISLTAGGRSTAEIEADEFTVPSFVRAKSRCGGPVTLIVDDSGSIGGNVDTVVKPGVAAFIEAFRGTPTQVQVVQFSSIAQSIGPNSASTNGGWHRYIDMTNDTEVDALLAAANSALIASGGTNWEEAFFHTFKESDGAVAATLPNRLVFFTDGIPTLARPTPDGWWSVPTFSNGSLVDFNSGDYNRSQGWPEYPGNVFHQESWDRADVILDQHRNVDMIFVGVGPGLTSDVNWIHNPAVYANPNALPASPTSMKGSDTIAYLLANAPSGQVPAIYDSASNTYTNPETADFYLQTSFDADAFAAAMRAAALKDCGGTLTVQTRLTDGTQLADEVVYENADYRDDTGTSVGAEPRRVTTSQNFRTGTFDFEISAASAFFEVDIVPSELETLGGYTFDSWTCRAGANDKSGDMTTIPIDGSTFEGFAISVLPNEAVSCVMEVSL